MQSVLGTSATVGFQLDLGVKLGVFYYTFLGNIRKAELHWYEAHGIGRKKIKIKRFLD